MAGIFVFDMNSLVRLKNHFPRDVTPLVWRTIEDGARNGSVILHNEVRREILRGGGEDALISWAEENRALFADINGRQTAIVEGEILVQFPDMAKPMKEGPHADPWLIAVALELVRNNGACACIVTEEKKRGKGSCQIPNVCDAYGLAYMNLVDFFRLMVPRWE